MSYHLERNAKHDFVKQYPIMLKNFKFEAERLYNFSKPVA